MGPPPEDCSDQIRQRRKWWKTGFCRQAGTPKPQQVRGIVQPQATDVRPSPSFGRRPPEDIGARGALSHLATASIITVSALTHHHVRLADSTPGSACCMSRRLGVRAGLNPNKAASIHDHSVGPHTIQPTAGVWICWEAVPTTQARTPHARSRAARRLECQSWHLGEPCLSSNAATAIA